TININLDRKDYTELLFKVSFEGKEFNPTTIENVVFDTRYETDSFYMPAQLTMLPTKNASNDTLYYINPLRVCAGG
ncbi:MAG: hypothetical protein UE068_03385, partial [Paludibacteraceae bacterium]|nr:hypothetical protein [Paludibacteraceae bacterium]